MTGTVLPREEHRISKIVWFFLLFLSLARGLFLYDDPKHRGCYEVYPAAGLHWLKREPLYQAKSPCVAFRYAPIIAIAFTPLPFLPSPLGSCLVRLVNWLVLFWGVSWWTSRFLKRSASKPRCALWLILIALISASALLDIQLNMLTLGLILVSIAASAEQRWNLSAMAIGLAICTKAYPVSLALLLVLIYPRQMIVRLLLILLSLLAFPFVFQPPDYVLQQYIDMMNGFVMHRDYDYWYQDFMSLWHHWIGPLDRFLYTLISIGAGGVIALASLRVRGKISGHDQLIRIFGMSCGWMMAFGPATESTTYVILAPVAALAMIGIWNGLLTRFSTALAVLAYLLLLLCQIQLVCAWNPPLNQMGFQPLAALLLIVVFADWQTRPRQPGKQIFFTSERQRHVEMDSVSTVAKKKSATRLPPCTGQPLHSCLP